MRYEITRVALGRFPTLAIEQADFAAIRDASSALISLLSIELDYDVLIGNWLQLEKAAMSLALDFFARPRHSRSEFDRDITELNRNIGNLLTSGTAFRYHTQANLGSLPGVTSADKNAVIELFKAKYDGNLSYKVIDELRDYFQHRGFPIEAFNAPAAWTGGTIETPEKLVISVSPYLRVDDLRSDRQFPKKVIEELKSANGEEVPVMPLLREYVASLSAVLHNVRELYKQKRETWSNTLDEWAQRYQNKCGEAIGLLGVAALQWDDDGNILQEVHLGVEIKERIAALQESKANTSLLRLHKLQVTS